MVKFISILKKIKQLVMGFTASNVVIENQNNNNIKQEKSLSPSQLNAKELEVLLSLIKTSTFLGEDVEIIYNMVVKLQNQYLEQTK
jgi:hypothetical protein